jgi:CheY-like chemotaxis protein/anti-sigma regulatory factor (Ser/Thr protein kinase)
VFSNLLTNASKYSASGEPVTLIAHRTGNRAEVIVADQGVGIPPDAIDSVFLPFHQLEHGRQSKKGLGIGLALVHSFVRMHAGSVTASSEGEGMGSTFTVRLPLAKNAPEATGPPRAKRRRKKSGLRILVVDDNDAAAAGIGRLLELQGCTVSYAYDGEQALDMANGSFNVIILDIGLHDIDGYTIAKTLRTRGYEGLLIALSGFSTPDSLERGKAAGFDHYLVKPAGMEDLRKAIPGLG